MVYCCGRVAWTFSLQVNWYMLFTVSSYNYNVAQALTMKICVTIVTTIKLLQIVVLLG